MSSQVPKNFRLGYACLNTELRDKGIFTSRTMRLATYIDKGFEYAKELAMANLNDLLLILEWNIKNDITFFRMSSEMFPFASHPKYGYSIDFADDILWEIGTYARANKMRLTMHPSHFNILAAKSHLIVANTILDLAHHCSILDKMGLDHNSVLILHGGGKYEDKAVTLQRLRQELSNLPKHIRDRLVLENCELNYNVSELLSISEDLLVPLVIDFHHDSIYASDKPVTFYFKRIFAVWKARGITPKVHVSNSVIGVTVNDSITARRKHSDHISYLHDALLSIKFPLDVMLESKLKEQSIFKLRILETHRS